TAAGAHHLMSSGWPQDRQDLAWPDGHDEESWPSAYGSVRPPNPADVPPAEPPGRGGGDQAQPAAGDDDDLEWIRYLTGGRSSSSADEEPKGRSGRGRFGSRKSAAAPEPADKPAAPPPTLSGRAQGGQAAAGMRALSRPIGAPRPAGAAPDRPGAGPDSPPAFRPDVPRGPAGQADPRTAVSGFRQDTGPESAGQPGPRSSRPEVGQQDDP